jgi:hypothetical protein
MDNGTLVLLAKFAFQARKLVGSIDLNSFTHDSDYRGQIFQRIESQADEDLLLLSLQVRSKFSAIGALSETVAKMPESIKLNPIEVTPIEFNLNAAPKYMLGARF